MKIFNNLMHPLLVNVSFGYFPNSLFFRTLICFFLLFNFLLYHNNSFDFLRLNSFFLYSNSGQLLLNLLFYLFICIIDLNFIKWCFLILRL